MWQPNPQVIDDCENLRVSQGYAANPFCTHCQGMGFVHPLDDKGKTLWNQVVPCAAKGCYHDSEAEYRKGDKYLASKGVSDPAATFGNFKARPGTQPVYDAFYELATGQANYFNLLVYGGRGNGKSHLSQALTRVLNQRWIDTWMYVVPSLLGLLKEHIQDNLVEQWMSSLKGMPGLVLDDLATEYGTDWEMAKLDELIVCRDRESKITVITSNQELAFLDQKYPRIISRFSDPDKSKLIFNEGSDYRLR